MKKTRHLIVPALTALIAFGIFTGSSNRLLAQETKKERIVRIVKIDENGNKIVEEKVLGGEEGNIEVITSDVSVEGDDNHFIFKSGEGDFDMEIDVEVDDEDGVVFKKKKVEVEDGETIVRTETVTKDKKGRLWHEEIEEVNGKVTQKNRKKISEKELDAQMKKDGNVHIIHSSGDTEEVLGEKLEGNKVIIIRKDLDEGENVDFEWISDGEENIDLEKILEEAGVKLDIVIDEEEINEDGKTKVSVRKSFVFVHIDDLEEEDVQVLNKAEEGGVNIEEAQSLKLNKLEFYPNPSNGKFTLDFELPSTKQGAEIRVMNMNGSEIFRESIQAGNAFYKKEIDLSNHPGGVYFLSITQGSERVIKKVVLQ